MDRKLHKSIRKYATFDIRKLKDLIELNSYELIETCQDFNSCNNKFMRFIDDTLDYTYVKFRVFKHKYENSYLTIANTKFNAYFLYTNGESQKLDRDKKPARIILYKYNGMQMITLCHYKDGKEHNDFGPAHLKYYKTKRHLRLFYISFYKNAKRYNKNGIVHYDESLNDSSTVVCFMKNNIISRFEFQGSIISITKANVETQFVYEITFYQDIVYKHMKRFSPESIHKLDGPALITKDPESKIIHKEWYVNNKKLPDDIVAYEKGKENKITKQDILKATLFDREYGNFLQEKYNETA